MAGILGGAVALSAPVAEGFRGGGGHFGGSSIGGIVSNPLQDFAVPNLRGSAIVSDPRQDLCLPGGLKPRPNCPFAILESLEAAGLGPPAVEVGGDTESRDVAISRDAQGNVTSIQNLTFGEVTLSNGVVFGPRAVVDFHGPMTVTSGYIIDDGVRYDQHSRENLTEREVRVEIGKQSVIIGPGAKVDTAAGKLLRGYVIIGGRRYVAGQHALASRYLVIPQKLEALLSRRLTQGQIQQAQARLKNAGFDPGPLDGVYGPLSQEAVRQYQSAYRLAITGLLDEATRTSLGVQ
jgi:hypothetical protein